MTTFSGVWSNAIYLFYLFIYLFFCQNIIYLFYFIYLFISGN